MKYSIGEIVESIEKAKTKEDKIRILRENNSECLRTLLVIIYDKELYEWLIPTEIPPYIESVHLDSQGMLYRNYKKVLYLIKGYSGPDLQQYRREKIFIEMLEMIDAKDAKFMTINVLQQKPIKGLTAEMINEAMGNIITKVK